MPDEQASAVVLVNVTHNLLDWSLLADVLQYLSMYYNGKDCPISPIIEEKLEDEASKLGKKTSVIIKDEIATKNHFDGEHELTINLSPNQARIVEKYYGLVVEPLKSWSVIKRRLMDSGAE